MTNTAAPHWAGVPLPDAAATLKAARLRLVDSFLAWASARNFEITVDGVLGDFDRTMTTLRLEALLPALRAVCGEDHPLCRTVEEARRQRRRDYLARYAPKTDTAAPHWAGVPHPEAAATLPPRRLATVDAFLAWAASKDGPITVDDLLRDWDRFKSEEPLKRLLESMVPLLGADHSLCAAVKAAAKIRCSGHRRSRRSQPKAVAPTRDALLGQPHWEKLRGHPAVQGMPMDRLRLTDRFFVHCTERGVSDLTPDHVLDFFPTQAPSQFWKLRQAMEVLYGLKHPITHVIEDARKMRWQDYARAKGVIGRPGPRPARALSVSVPEDALPTLWRGLLDRMEAGEPVRGRKLARASVRGMRQAARELLYSARRAGLPDELSETTVRAYDTAFAARGLRPMACAALVLGLWRLARALGDADIRDALHELHRHYKRRAAQEQKAKEIRYAALRGLPEIFDTAFDLLDRGRVERHAASRTTLLVDAAAVTFLSLIPLRSADTVIRWGEHLGYDEAAADDWIYRIDTSITKTGTVFGGHLHPILNPFLEAVILQGRDPMFLPKLRREVIDARAPVFPTSTGRVRCVRGLSQRWQEVLGAGSHIARTQVHTLLGALGPGGVDAALTLCAQRAPETRKHYQAEGLKGRLMRDSQDSLAVALPKDLTAARVARFQAEQEAMSNDRGGSDTLKAV